MMQIIQKIAFGYTRIQFTFGEDKLDYLVLGENLDFGFSVLYENISLERSFITVKEKWPFNFSMTMFTASLLTCIGAGINNINLFSTSGIMYWLSFDLAVIPLVLYNTFFKREVIVLPTSKGNILILKDPLKDTILEKITSFQKSALKKKYAYINPCVDPAQEILRLRNLKEKGILTDSDFNSLINSLSFGAS